MTGSTHPPTEVDRLGTVGSVALDIGEGHGALIVHTGLERAGEEIEVECEADGSRTHVAVLRRDVSGRAAAAAVFGSLPEGTYRFLDGARSRTVAIAAGAITEVASANPS